MMLLLLLSHCDNRRQTTPIKDEITNEVRVFKLKNATVESKSIDLKTRLQTVYQENFSIPISKTELSMVHVYFSSLRFYCHCCEVSIIRTVTGNAIAQYRTCLESGLLELELSIGEWLVFINALYKLRIHEWREARKEIFGEGRIGCSNDSGSWGLEIFFSSDVERDDYTDEYNIGNIEKREYSSCTDAWPNWNEFKDIIDNKVEKIRTEGKPGTNWFISSHQNAIRQK
jgi:hypothetical protein